MFLQMLESDYFYDVFEQHKYLCAFIKEVDLPDFGKPEETEKEIQACLLSVMKTDTLLTSANLGTNI